MILLAFVVIGTLQAGAHHDSGAVVCFVLAVSYLVAVRHRHRLRVGIQQSEPPARQPVLRARSSRAAAGKIGLAEAGEQASPTPEPGPGLSR